MARFETSGCDFPKRNITFPSDRPYHAFLSHSNQDNEFALKLFNTLESEEFGFKICYHERDFIPGQPILSNISTAIKDSLKTIIILSPNFSASRWCQLEAELTMSLSIDMEESEMLIPLLIADGTDIPDFVKPFKLIDARGSHGSVEDWFPKLVDAISVKPKSTHGYKIPTLKTGQSRHLLIIHHHEDELVASKMSQSLSDAQLSCDLYPSFKDTNETIAEITDLISKIKSSVKIVLLLSKSSHACEKFIFVVKLVKMQHRDLGLPEGNIIPILFDLQEDNLPVCLEDMTYLRETSESDEWMHRLEKACCIMSECLMVTCCIYSTFQSSLTNTYAR